MSAKLKITARGKKVVASACILIVSISVIGLAIWDPRTENYSDEVYTYSITLMLDQSKQNEMSAREELKEKIESANTLIKDTDGKVFDASRTNLQTYVNSITDIPESQIVESDNILDYVNSESRIQTFITKLSEKHNALQTSYNAWQENRTEFDENLGKLEEELTTGISTAGEMEQAILENIEESERLIREREERQREIENERRERKQDAAPAPPVPDNTPDPVEPSPIPKTPDPVAPSPKPSTSPPPTPTENPSPTTPVEPDQPEEEDEETSMIGIDNA